MRDRDFIADDYIMQYRDRIGSVEKIVVVSSFAIGDMLMATPMIKALRSLFPKAIMDLAQLPGAEEVTRGWDVLNSVYEYFDGIRFSQYDLAVLPLGYVGQEAERAAKSAKMYLIHPVATTGWKGYAERHQVDINMDLVRMIGFKGETPKVHLPYMTGKGDKRKKHNVGGLYINKPQNSFQGKKSWPVERWRELISRIGKGKVLLLGGPMDQETVQDLSEDTGAAYEITPDLSSFAELSRSLKWLITTDGACMHMAAITGTSTVSMHGLSSPLFVGPWEGYGNRAVMVLSSAPCAICQKTYLIRVCENATCMKKIETDEVLKGLSHLGRMRPGEGVISWRKKLYTRQSFRQSRKRKILRVVNYYYGFARNAIKIRR